MNTTLYKAKHDLINERQNILDFGIGQIRWEKSREGEEEEEKNRRWKKEGEKKSKGIELFV